ncbi:hypothetical protein ABZP36_030029 [Zizania latifolia]
MSHVAHPHNLQREVLKIGNLECGMCARSVGVSERVYRCQISECKNFLLHEACFRMPKNIEIVSVVGRLKLITNTNPGVLRGNHRCKICAKSMADVSCVYKGAVDNDFRVHPRCGVLQPRVTLDDEHCSHCHPLYLRMPTESNNRKCVSENHHGAGGGGRGQPQAWSYKCVVNEPACQGVEFCVECALGNNSKKTELRCCCCCCDLSMDDVRTCSCVAHGVGSVIKSFILGLFGQPLPAN